MARGGGAGDGSGDLGGGGGGGQRSGPRPREDQHQVGQGKRKCHWHGAFNWHPSITKAYMYSGDSSGTVFAWDLRWQQQLILLSGVGLNGTDQRVSESEVWEVQFDSYTQSSGITSAPSTKILPVMVCLEYGILAVLEQGEDPVELLAKPCAFNAFDIDPQNPSDVVCALEWENIAILLRGRDAWLFNKHSFDLFFFFFFELLHISARMLFRQARSGHVHL
uniref:Nuclear pore complex protein NUP43 n=1 Tax=Ananas comosus var. bracteatus TaxID=296719 RepID=A0A6V7QCN1_ANACO|nr:unnamed protein product [Ananas comosus var. bracteatus]